MSKLGLIIKREYLTRVTKKSFIIGTLLAPIGLAVYLLVIIGLTKYDSGSELKVAVLDEAGMVKQLPDEKGVRYLASGNKTLEQLKAEVGEKKLDGILRIPPLGNFQKKEHTVFYYSDQKLAPEKSMAIEKKIADRVRDFKIDSLHLDPKTLDMLDTDISIDPEKITGTGEDESKYTAGVGLAIGGVMAFIMFFMVTMYGAMVMRSVMEEKTNRIVEVIISSVKPFQLMMGKILGVSAVGLTQMLIWMGMTFVLTQVATAFLGVDPGCAQGGGASQGGQGCGRCLSHVVSPFELRQYMASICAAYFFSTSLRLSFMVGVSSSSSAVSWVSSRKNFLICSTRANFWFTRLISFWINSCTSGARVKLA